MLLSRYLTIIPKYFQPKSRPKYPIRCINYIRPGNYSNHNRFSCLPLLKSAKYRINSRLQHNELKSMINDHEKLSKVLTRIENENDFSIDTIRLIVHEIQKSLRDEALDPEHIKILIESETFLKLVKAVEESIHKMEVNDIIEFLDLCNQFRMVHKIKSIMNIIKTVKDHSENLTLSNEIKFSLMLNVDLLAIDKELVLFLRKYYMNKIERAIKNKLYRNNPEDTISMLQTLPLFKKLTIDDKIHVLYSTLDLKNWNDLRIFKLFLNVNLPSDHPLTEDIREKFLERMKKEISLNNKYLSDFLVGYSKNIKNGFIDYNRDLIDAAVNQILTNKLNSLQIKKICSSLSELSHRNYQFVECLIDFLEKTPNIYSSNPAVTALIIETIANSNCSYEEKNRWAKIQPVVNKANNLSNVFESLRKNSKVSYIYFLTQLASLGIFVDAELNVLRELLAKDLKQRNTIEKYLIPWNTRMLIVNLNFAVKVLHPSYPGPILNDSSLEFATKKLFSVHKESLASVEKLETLSEMEKCLAAPSGVTNCILLNCINKFGFPFDGLIGMNKEGKLLDFKSTFKNENKVFLEDITLPKGYDLVALHLVTVSEQSKNTWDLKAASSLRLKITEGLGIKTVIIYESLWKSLRGDEKEKFLYALQG